MKIKVSETTPIQLDWLVAKCLNAHGDWKYPEHFAECHRMGVFNHSTDPTQGQPILEREGIGFFCNRTAEIGARFNPDAGADWRAFALNKHGVHFYGPTMLTAGLRCYVASKLGDEVEVPDELI